MDIGAVIKGQYKVIEHIGRGGMADVWSARDKQLNRTVAIKTVARDLSSDSNPLRLFEREARTIAGLEHPHILPIYEFGEFGGQLYIVMRYVSGGSMEKLLEDGPLPLPEVMRLARAVGQALEYAHANMVIHLDLKPSNILLDTYQSPYLADFGLATALDPQGRAANPGSGTLLYMAPEQMTSDELDHRADIYSFCIMLFHMMTGQLPFDAAIPMALKQIQQRAEMPDPRTVNPVLPGEIANILRHGTTMDINRRANTIREVVEALEAVIMPGRAAAVPVLVATPAPRVTPIIARDGATTRLEELISGPLDNLISRPADELLTMPITGDLGYEVGDNLTPIDLGEAGASMPGMDTDAQSRREAEELFNRARRNWARGKGRFLLGMTHFMLISDFYLHAADHHLQLDDAGIQMLLRGALEYDHGIEAWWARLSDEDRRWVCLHAVRSENTPARVRALDRLHDLPDSEPPQIPKLVAQALQVEQGKEAKLAAIRVLEARAKWMQPAAS